jgi:cold shock CspA family protein
VTTAGTVVSFDEAVGLGVVEAEAAAGGVRYGFHCTQIAGGERSIAAGTVVRFDVGPGRKGTWEAFNVTAAGTRGDRDPAGAGGGGE